MSLENNIKATIAKSVDDAIDSYKDGELNEVKNEIRDTLIELTELRFRIATCVDKEDKQAMIADSSHLVSSLSSLQGISKGIAIRLGKESLVKIGTLVIEAAKTL